MVRQTHQVLIWWIDIIVHGHCSLVRTYIMKVCLFLQHESVLCQLRDVGAGAWRVMVGAGLRESRKTFGGAMFAITCEPLWWASVLSTIASGLESTFRHLALIALPGTPLHPHARTSS